MQNYKILLQELSTIIEGLHICLSDKKPLLSDNVTIYCQRILFLGLIVAMEKFWPKVFLLLQC